VIIVLPALTFIWYHHWKSWSENSLWSTSECYYRHFLLQFSVNCEKSK